MRSPRASSVIVALSTFVAVAMVALVVSQLTPVERAGAVLPIAPITAPEPEVDTLGIDEAESEAAPETSTDGSGSTGTTGGSTGTTSGSTTDGGTSVVTPAPPVTVTPDPEPEPSTPATPTSPGNSGNAPGQGGSNPGNGTSNGSENRP